MALSLQPKLKQTTRVSPAMRLEMSLLALPIDDLKAEVKKELDSNPALEGNFPLYLPKMAGLTGANGFLIDNARARGVSLVEHLISELRMSGLNARQLEIATAVVCRLGETGYFEGTYADLQMELSANGLNVTDDELEKARQFVMTIDPKGCGARDLCECFKAQLRVVPASEREKVASLLPRMCQREVSAEELAYLKPFIAKMRPSPGKAFEYVKVNYITPDISVDRAGVIQVDTGDIPALTVSPKYVEMAKDRELDAETRAYAAEKVRRARDFLSAIDNRHQMIERIAEITIGSQTEFIKYGPSALKVLTMTEVAKAAKCAISTVSRAAERKFVKTPRGTIPLRAFFAIRDHAPYEKLREIMASLPTGEKPSDQKLSEMMSAAGYPMARRTVAKWRKRME